MFDLTLECAKYLKLTFPAKGNVKSLVVSGGFARNMLYINYLVKLFPEKKVYTSQVDNASALGAALACSQKMVNQENLKLDLGLKLWA